MDNAEILQIQAHGKTIQMYDTGGKISNCFRRDVPYEKPLLEHIYQQEYAGIAVDAGANIGNHSLWFALVCGLRVAAFEPLQTKILRDHVALNDATSLVTVEPVALGDTDSQAVHVAKGQLDPSGKKSFPQGEQRRLGTGLWSSFGERVEVRTLDGYELSDVSVIKIDVEGMEPFVLRGGIQTIRASRPHIYAETWGRKEDVAIATVLKPLGYTKKDEFSAKVSRTPVAKWVPMT